MAPEMKPRPEYKGQISVMLGMKINRPQGGTPVTGDILKTEDPSDKRLDGLRAAQ